MNAARTILGLFGCATGVALVTACGDVYADPDPAPTPSATVDAGIAAVTDARANSMFPEDPIAACPTTRPRENTSCSQEGAACEYGTSADRECNVRLACEGQQFQGAWTPRPNDTCFSSICPESADVGSLDGKPCELESDGEAITDADEAVCNMTDGVCACTTGRDGATKHERRWVCVRPISVCPPNRPLLGTPCSGGLWCDYGSCSFKRGLLMECTAGMWLTGGASCQ